MYSGLNPQQALGMVLQRQEETRIQVRREVEGRRVSRPAHERRPVAFKLWRMHVMVWLGEVRKA
jgi:hypothetical protein